jgi:hypothetical protein
MVRTSGRTVLLILLLLGLTGPGSSQQQDPPKQDPSEAYAQSLLDRAIQAVGGPGRLAKVSAVTAGVKGTFHFANDRTIPLTFRCSVEGMDRFRLELDMLQARPLAVTVVARGAKSWVNGDNKRFEVLKTRLFDYGLAHDIYAVQLAQLLTPLKDKAFRLSSVGEIKIGERPALGFRVSHDGRPDVNIYLDKETSVPVKCELRIQVAKAAQEFTHEIFLHDFKTVDGVKLFTRLTVNRDETKLFTAELSDLQVHEVLDAKTFAEP